MRSVEKGEGKEKDEQKEKLGNYKKKKERKK